MIAKLGRQHRGVQWKHFPSEAYVRQLIQTQLELILPSIHGYCLVTLGELADDFTFEMASVVNVVRLNAAYANSGWVIPSQLPLSDDDIDAIFLPFELEQSEEPHALLRESYRALRPGGKLLLCTMNPISLWGIRRLVSRFDSNPLWRLPFYRNYRLMDWLSILDFDVKVSHGLLNPLWSQKMIKSEKTVRSSAYSILGCFNFIVAEKRRIPLTLKPQWRKLKSRNTIGIEGLRKTLHSKPFDYREIND